MAGRRPPVLTVMGILNIVFGSLFLLCAVCGGIGLLFMMNSSSMFNVGGVNILDDMWDFMKREIPGYVAVTVATLLLSLVLNIVLLVSGIGLLNMRRWGRTLSLIYGVSGILMQIGSLIYTLVLVNPAMGRWQQAFLQRMGGRLPPGGLGAGNSTTNNLMSVIGGVLGIIYAVVLLIMMLQPSVGKAFAGVERSGGPEDDYERRPRRDEWDY